MGIVEKDAIYFLQQKASALSDLVAQMKRDTETHRQHSERRIQALQETVKGLQTVVTNQQQRIADLEAAVEQLAESD